MKASEFESRLPEKVKLTYMRLRLGEVVYAKGVVIDPQGRTTNMKVAYTSDGKAFARWMSTPMLHGDLILEGWKYKRFEKYDLKEKIKGGGNEA